MTQESDRWAKYDFNEEKAKRLCGLKAFRRAVLGNPPR